MYITLKIIVRVMPTFRAFDGFYIDDLVFNLPIANCQLKLKLLVMRACFCVKNYLLFET